MRSVRTLEWLWPAGMALCLFGAGCNSPSHRTARASNEPNPPNPKQAVANSAAANRPKAIDPHPKLDPWNDLAADSTKDSDKPANDALARLDRSLAAENDAAMSDDDEFPFPPATPVAYQPEEEEPVTLAASLSPAAEPADSFVTPEPPPEIANVDPKTLNETTPEAALPGPVAGSTEAAAETDLEVIAAKTAADAEPATEHNQRYDAASSKASMLLASFDGPADEGSKPHVGPESKSLIAPSRLDTSIQNHNAPFDSPTVATSNSADASDHELPMLKVEPLRARTLKEDAESSTSSPIAGDASPTEHAAGPDAASVASNEHVQSTSSPVHLPADSPVNDGPPGVSSTTHDSSPVSPPTLPDASASTAAAGAARDKDHAAAHDGKPLTLSNASFCTQVLGFGRIEPMPSDALLPGQEVLIYAEIAHFVSAASAGKHETKIATRIAIETKQGLPVASVDFDPIVDQCHTVRTDFFCHYAFALPKTLPPGAYVVRIHVKDCMSGNAGETSLPFAVVSSK